MPRSTWWSTSSSARSGAAKKQAWRESAAPRAPGSSLPQRPSQRKSKTRSSRRNERKETGGRIGGREPMILTDILSSERVKVAVLGSGVESKDDALHALAK